MTERIRLTDDFDGLAPAPWHEVTRGRPALRLEVLKALLRSSSEPMRLEAFLLEDAAGLAATAVFRHFPDRQAVNEMDRFLYGRGTRLARALGCSTAPLMLCSPPHGSGCGIAVRPDTPIAAAQRILHRLLDEIESCAEARGCAIAVRSAIADDDAVLASVLTDRGYAATVDAPTTRLAIQWQDLDGYVEHLRRHSRSAARTVRYEINHNERSGVAIRRLPPEEAHARALDALARSHYKGKNGVEPPYGPEFLPRLLAGLPEDFLVFEARRGEQVLGMIGLVRSGTVAWAAWVGLVDQDQRRDFTYFNLCFYHVAARAASLGIRRLLYGNGAYRAKLIRGCELVVHPVFYRPRSAVARALAPSSLRIHRAWYRRKFA